MSNSRSDRLQNSFVDFSRASLSRASPDRATLDILQHVPRHCSATTCRGLRDQTSGADNRSASWALEILPVGVIGNSETIFIVNGDKS
jgi:hypothetical protein